MKNLLHIIVLYNLLGAGAALGADNVYPGTTLRFHPGHYLLLAAQTPVASVVDEVATNPHFLGVSQRYEWVNLELAEGVYDFSSIRRDIDLLKARNKRLIVQIRDVSFSIDPFIPVPAYMRTAEYAGGFQGYRGGRPGFIAKRWIPAVGERYRALLRALGDEFRNEPFLEAVKTDETAMDIDRTQGGYTKEAYLDELKLNIDTLATAFPTTVTVQFANFLDGGNNALGMLAAHARSRRVGWGGPDLVPLRQGLLNGAYLFYPLHDGAAPLMIDVQEPEYEPRTEGPYTPLEMLEFGVANLNLNYICWSRVPEKWPKVLAAISDPRYPLDEPGP